MRCVRRRGGGEIGSERDAWWWDEEVKEAVSRKKVAYRAMCQNCAKENKRRY